jgi:hypothetical protein
MNCSQAKQIPIIGFLASRGKHPVKIRNGQAVYHSPFSADKTASLYVDFKEFSLQVWNDFSTGAGGNILDLVMKMYNVDIREALKILQETEITKVDFSFFSQQEVKARNIEIKRIQPLQNRALIEYLQSRKITPVKAANYVQEAYYTTYKEQVKPFFAIAFKNDLGGFELRNGFKSEKLPDGFKGGSTPKTITTITGQHQTALNIFEGFFNFLSALQYYNATRPRFDTIVLNSTTNVDTVLPILQQYQKINLFLDNDTTGNHATDTIKQHHHAVVDYRYIYSGQNDMNDFLTTGNPAQINN